MFSAIGFISTTAWAQPVYPNLNNAEYKKGKEKLPHKLKRYDKAKSYKCKKCKMAAQTTLNAEEQFGMISLSSNQAMNIKKVFRCRRDGIVVEYVGFDQYNCNNPDYSERNARYNGTGSINGYISKPVYRKEMVKVIRKEKRKFKRDKKVKIMDLKNDPDGYDKEDLKEAKKEKFNLNFFSLGLEMKPRFADANVTQNILVVHGRRIHFPKYKPESCGDPKVAVHVDLIDKPLNIKYDFDTRSDAKTLTFRNYYRRGKTQINDSVFAAIKDSIGIWHIDEIHIKSFSSVEGFDTINERYHNERAQNVRTGLKEFYRTEPELKVKSKENWSVFRKQVKKSKYKSWLKLKKEKIKEHLTNPEMLEYWDPLLDEQRFSEIELWVTFEEHDTLSFVKSKMKKLEELDDDILRQYHQYLKINDPVAFQEIKYPEDDRYEFLWYDQINEYIAHMNLKNTSELRELGNRLYLYSKVYNNDILFLNAEIFIIMHGDKIGLRKGFRSRAMERITELIDQSQYRDESMQLKVAYYLTYIPKMNPAVQYKEVMEGLEFVSDYYYYFNDSIFYDTEKITDIIDFFVQYRTDLAMLFLDKYFEELKLFDPHLFSQYLKLSYNHPKHFNDRSYVQTVLNAKEKLSEEDWCNLFIGKCNINFQLFDDGELRKLYCKTCGPTHYLKQVGD